MRISIWLIKRHFDTFCDRHRNELYLFTKQHSNATADQWPYGTSNNSKFHHCLSGTHTETNLVSMHKDDRHNRPNKYAIDACIRALIYYAPGSPASACANMLLALNEQDSQMRQDLQARLIDNLFGWQNSATKCVLLSICALLLLCTPCHMFSIWQVCLNLWYSPSLHSMDYQIWNGGKRYHGHLTCTRYLFSWIDFMCV